ncbi:C4-dicarboxylate ABC transporter permease [Gallibacterium anatis str. Avicor]|uniref:TRAP transporter small permease n=1 Tax=Gallibacterium anatis TaxID=750 RepID=UPI000531CD07|nr:TRAP transporter small permease [Gallibacterium anatis]KGQ56396.1 C4-dicarboxylate ABC transporter permease [Gallibacterium anatis str. Avicor]
MRKVIDIIAELELIISACFLSIFVMTTFIQVISRYFHISVIWTEEVSVNAFIWSILLGAAVMTRKKRHFSFSFLKNKIESEQYKCILSLIQNGIILCFSIICLVYSAEITSSFWNSKWVTIPIFRQGYVWLILPITFSSIILFLLEDCFDKISLLIRKK